MTCLEHDYDQVFINSLALEGMQTVNRQHPGGAAEMSVYLTVPTATVTALTAKVQTANSL